MFMRHGWVLIPSILILSACGDDEVAQPQPTDIAITADATGDVQATDTGTRDDADLSVGPDIGQPDTSADASSDAEQQAATLSLAIGGLTADSTSGTLYPVDDVDTEQPGIQVRVAVTASQLADGTMISLRIAGAIVSEAPLSNSGVVFERVDAPMLPNPYTVEVTGQDADGNLVSASKEVRVETAICDIDITIPQLEDGSCVTTDEDDNSPGHQFTLIAKHVGKVCPQVRLDVSIGDEDSSAVALFDTSGQATLVVDLGERVNGSAELKVTAEHPGSDSLDGVASESVSFDFEAPTLTITTPDAAIVQALELSDDQDPLTAGIQYDIRGTATGLTSGSIVSLEVNGVLRDEAIYTDDAFVFEAVTFTSNQSVDLQIRASDACGNTGTASQSLEVYATAAALSIVAPSSGVLLAKDDDVLESGDSYELTFSVEALDLWPSHTLAVECRAADDPETVYFEVASTTTGLSAPTDGLYALSASLPIGILSHETVCRARYDGPNATTSSPVAFTIALPGPTIALLQPATGTSLNEASITFALEGTELDGQGAEFHLKNSVGETLSVVESLGTFEDGTLVESVSFSVADGPFIVCVDAIDSYGNRASDLAPAPCASLTLDATAPVLALSSPTSLLLDPINTPSHADQAPDTPGYQTTLSVQMSNETVSTGAQICATVANQVLDCQEPDANFVVTWDNIDLLPGDNNPVTITGQDAVGNEATALALNITLQLDEPLVQVMSPSDGTITAAESIDLEVSVQDSTSQSPIPGASVSLQVNGQPYDIAVIDQQNGNYTFNEVALAPGDNVMQVLVEFSGQTGASQQITVVRKTTSPSISLTNISDGALFNQASTECFGSGADCDLSITAALQQSEAGSVVNLTVDCTQSQSNYQLIVGEDASEASFSNVILSHGGSCMLSAEVTDLAGQTATSDSITVTVDRVAPVLETFVSPSNTYLLFFNDTDPLSPGIQHPLQVNVSGLEAGRIITAQVVRDEVVEQTLTHEVSQGAGDDEVYLADFGQLTFPEGDIILTVSFEDNANNPGGGQSALTVAGSLAVRLVTPTFPGESCDQGCAPSATCNANACWHKWGQSFTQQDGKITVSTAGFVGGEDQLRICSDNPSFASETPCEHGDGTFFEVLRTDATGGNQQIDLSQLLSPGFHRLSAELRPGPETAWVTSLDELQPNVRERRVLVDLITPTVTAMTCTTDLNDDSYVNISELGADDVITLQITASEDGPVSVLENDVVIGTGDITGGVALVNVTPGVGSLSLSAEVTDTVGNTGTLETPLTLTIDNSAPIVSFENPASEWLGQNSDLNVRVAVELQSYEESFELSAELYDNEILQSSVTIVNGLATFPTALEEGQHELTVRVIDPALNETTVATVPAVVTVDTVPPNAAIISPSQGAVLSTDVDADTDGLQVNVEFGVGEDTHSVAWSLEVAGCDASFSVCDDFIERANGTVTSESTRSEQVTIDANELTEYRRIRITSIDAAGNQASDTVDVSVELSNCVVGFSDLPTSGWWNAQDCTSPASPSCAGTVTAQISGACATLATVELYDGDILIDSQMAAGDDGVIAYAVTANDGVSLQLQLRAMIGTWQIATSSVQTLLVDLNAPQLTLEPTDIDGFTTPSENTVVSYGSADDQSTEDGFQLHLFARLVDTHAADSEVLSVTIESADNPQGDVITICSGEECSADLVMSGFDLTLALEDLTIPGDQRSILTLYARDPAGNVANSSLLADVDVTAPSAISFDEAASTFEARLPRVTLSFTAPGNDGDLGQASAYEFRYSRQPIDDDNIDDACTLDGLVHGAAPPSPEAAGNTQNVVFQGPDPRDPQDACKFSVRDDGVSTWYFAARAIDDHGNWSSLGPNSVLMTDALQFNRTRVVFSDTFRDEVVGGDEARRDAFTEVGTLVGDVNGDGLGDWVTGSLTANGFCLFYGNDALPETWPVDGPSQDQGLQHDCAIDATSVLADVPTAKELGTQIAAMGDVNGDGIDDFGVSGKVDDNFGFLLIYLGLAGDGPDVNAPNVIVTGVTAPFGGFFQWCSAGQFTGESSHSFAIGEPAFERITIFPGNPAWDATATQATPVTVNMLAAASEPRLTINTVEGSQGGVTFFGFFCAPAGDVLDTPAPNTDLAATELLVTNAFGVQQVIVVPGRPITESLTRTLTVVPDSENQTAEDTLVSRLIQELLGAKAGFPSGLVGTTDLTGDGIVDIVAAHTARSPSFGGDGKTIYIYDGDSIRSNAGGNQVQVEADTTGVGASLPGTHGWIINTELVGNFNAVRPVGNWDGWSVNGAETPDLLYGTGTTAQLHVNHEDEDNGVELGSFPWIDYRLGDPNETVATGFWNDGGMNVGGSSETDILSGSKSGVIIITH